ncbi:MAG: hemolysin family protein [Turneriella sp.]|nr:hemolysin family protein [Leptospiraceae bacterium]MCX7631993.1 hemolysin family protein [Turneriella sp.]
MVSVLIFAASIVAAGFFAATEVAFFSLTPLSVARGERSRLEKLLLRKNEMIAMLLAGNNLAIVSGTLALDTLLTRETSIEYRVAVFFLEILLFFVLSEVIPKAVGQKLGIKLLENSYSLLWLCYFLLLPISFVFLRLSRALGSTEKSRTSRSEIFRFIAQHTADNRLPLADSLATYSSTTIREIMTPMSEMISLPANATLRDCAEIIEKSSYSRYPVYDSIPAEIVGYIDLRDCLSQTAGTRVQQIMRTAHFYPASLSVDQLHEEMRRLKLPMVFVVNEYGLVIGLITEEDLAEELVGDIFSHDQKLEMQYLIEKEPGSYEIDCAMDIDDFAKIFSIPIKKHNFETVGGYLMAACGYIPQKGEVLDLPAGRFTILEATARTVRKVEFKPAKVKKKFAGTKSQASKQHAKSV